MQLEQRDAIAMSSVVTDLRGMLSVTFLYAVETSSWNSSGSKIYCIEACVLVCKRDTDTVGQAGYKSPCS